LRRIVKNEFLNANSCSLGCGEQFGQVLVSGTLPIQFSRSRPVKEEIAQRLAVAN
jgi:hypothetical protein